MSEQKSDSVSSSTNGVARSSRFRERLSITSTLLNGKNYAVWAKAVEVYYLGETVYHILTDDAPAATAGTYGAWVSEDARIRSELWNSMEDHISSTLVFLPTAKQVWTQAQEMYSGVNNLRRTYDLHQSFFSIAQGDLSLESYYSKFRGICEELNICEPISADVQVMKRQRERSANVQVMKRQRERMQVTRFISGVSSTTYGPVCNQLLGSRDLPSLSEVFSRLRQPSVSVPVPPPNRSALASAVFGGSGSSFSRGRGRGRDSGFSGRGRDSGFNGDSGRGFGRGSGGRVFGFGTCGGRISGGGSRGRGRDSRFCTHCRGTNHTVEFCYELHGFPQAHQVAISHNAGQLTYSSADNVVTISAEEYQRLVSFQSPAADSSSTATLAQKGPSAAFVASSSTPTPWVIDSGASDHMTGSQDGEEDWWGY